MDETFFRQWFQGFEAGLDAIIPEARSSLLKHCARRCADTGVLEAYRKLHREVNGDRNEFYRRMQEVGAVRGEILLPDLEYLVCFPACTCDLHSAGGVNSPSLCECSRQSILYVGEQLWESPFRVEQVETILSGAKECRFRIVFD